jgi:hypothetical protein
MVPKSLNIGWLKELSISGKFEEDCNSLKYEIMSVKSVIDHSELLSDKKLKKKNCLILQRKKKRRQSQHYRINLLYNLDQAL